jgi:hypothetical protein
VLATDLVPAMATQVPAAPGVHVVVADVRHLPVDSRSVDLIVGLNAVPDLAEFRRVLVAGGSVLWVSSYGEESPLHLDPEVLADAWEGESVVTTARAGHGHWTLLTTEGKA